jgi:DNA repair protein RadA/Sms
MAKDKTSYACAQCGQQSSRWLGKCPGCGEWNTMAEAAPRPGAAKRPAAALRARPVRMTEIDLTRAPHEPIGIDELDRVLGGGLVEGGVILVGGEPGVGKSTLLLQAAEMVARGGRAALYVSGEESARQVRMRAKRIGASSEQLYMLSETDIDEVCAAFMAFPTPFVILDSIQTMQKQGVSASTGSVSQIRECAATALRAAKETGATVVLIGHVTKEGNIAGPRVLEHMVDTVLYFEGERRNSFRILRAVKNRFGSTNEIGVFEMTQAGMQQVQNPSAQLISRHGGAVPGAAITCTIEGTRPMLCEVQALCAASPFGQPRRMATGVDYNRMLLMIAVLERIGGVGLYNRDVYMNAVGGLRLSEPSADAALMAALCSAATGRPLKQGTAVVGEVDLTGEMRQVSQVERRAGECAKLGFTHFVVPYAGSGGLKPHPGIEYVRVKNVQELMRAALIPKAAATNDEKNSFD